MAEQYNPNNVSVPNGNYFSFPFTADESSVVLLSVPWDVTTSYRPGTSRAPEAIVEASAQLDMYDFHNPDGWKNGVATLPIDYTILDESRHLREEAEKVIIHLESGGRPEEEYAAKKLKKINASSRQLNDYVYAQSKEWLEKGKIVGLVGGDHSTPLGLIKALGEKYGDIGVLQIDAHADLREAYEGFEYSHASIMYNVLKEVPQITSLVQVGVRDVCSDEMDRIASDDRITTFFDRELSDNRFEGRTWREQCDRIMERLPQNVYVSFDIDGLSPAYCPHTGTPVPGGLDYNEAVCLLGLITASGRRLIGFDLCEVVPDPVNDWDAIVGARLLYKLSNISMIR